MPRKKANKDNQINGRNALNQWREAITENIYSADALLDHSVRFAISDNCDDFILELKSLGQDIGKNLEQLVAENDFRLNMPKLDSYDGVGTLTNDIIHHPNYQTIGNAIYATGMMKKIAQPGKLTESLLLFYLTSHLGEAGHNCPVACTAGIIRVLGKVADFQGKDALLAKLTTASFTNNFTGAQFITEVQGGSDVALNSCKAVKQPDNSWQISGEKWFCSNANADLILLTARFDEGKAGTKGLGLFLLKRLTDNGEPNHIQIRRLKEKLGTRAMASAEMDFQNAQAISMGKPEDGFKLLMQNVLHLSRIYNSFAILGAAQRAYQIARKYAKYRIAFSQVIENYPLVQERLAVIRAENTAMLASALATTRLQDKVDCMPDADTELLLVLRMRANINKYFTASRSVQHIHHCIDVLAGNGAIESFSPLPRLLRDGIVYENWEGTHNTLRMQILRDMHKSQIEKLFINNLLKQLVAHEDCKIANVPQWLETLQQALTKQLDFAEFLKRQTIPKQSLLVRDFIDQIALLDACVHLLLAGIDQQKHDNNSDKLKLLEWLLIKNKLVSTDKYSDYWMSLMQQTIMI
ncbi:Acyl-CoA dehydrogenase [hydrothermal vent metagenome]|uniref:Acyl-CoA dehydrogenase n=1 Tax=hydrothermal vent metagenome TaxID=652676 RepID=A0A3B0VF40_9ZZZZ